MAITRWVYRLLLCAFALGIMLSPRDGLAAPAAGVFALDRADGAAETAPKFWIRSAVPREWGPQEVAKEGDRGFVPFDADQVHPMNEQQALWVQWRVRTPEFGSGDAQWTLVFSKPFVDRVSLYYCDETGQWRSLTAGGMVPHAQWPLRRLQPQFILPALAQGEQTLYLKVELDVPIRFGLQLLPEPEAQRQSQNRILVAGLALGLMGLMAALCAVMTVSYRDAVFAYYGLYAVLAMLLSASYMGVASYLLWPQSPHWGGIANLSLSLLTIGAQLLFCCAVFLRDQGDWLPRRVVLSVLLFTAVVAALFLGTYHGWLLVLYIVALVLNVGVILWIVLRALAKRSRLAGWWLASYVPFYALIGAGLTEHLGAAAMTWLPYNAPVYAILVEMLILMAALHQYGKAGHAQRVRARALQRMQPDTAFLEQDMFDKLCHRAWRLAQEHDTDVAIAYVQVLPSSRPARAKNWTPALALQRCSRLLHQVLRSQDWVCRVSDDTVVIAMPHMSMGDALTERFSRLVALGLMSDTHDPGSLELRFRISVGTKRTYPGALPQLRRSLQAALSAAEHQSQPPIIYLNLTDNLPSQSELEDIWEQALEASEKTVQELRPSRLPG